MQNSRTARAATFVVSTVFIAALVLTVSQVLGVFRLVPVLSGSMSGFVESGDAAVLRPADVADLAAGDVLAFYPPVPQAPLTLHRIVDVDRSTGSTVVRTAGDANSLDDPWRARLAEGTAWRANGIVLEGVGRWVLHLQRPFVRMVLLAGLLAIILTAALRRIWRPELAAPDDEGLDDGGAATELHRALPVVTTAAVVLVAATVALGTRATTAPAVSAGFTTGDSAAHVVTASWSSGPTEPDAALVCDLGVPTSVRITWTASTSGDVTGYLVERGPSPDGPFTEVGRTQGTVYNDEAIEAVLNGDLYYRVRGVTSTGTTPPTEAVTLLATCPAPTGDTPEPIAPAPDGTGLG